MSSQNQGHPSAAPLVIRVGVTGHRLVRLMEDKFDESLIRQSIREILEIVRQTADHISTESQGAYEGVPVLRLISPLAEGADRLVAQEALALGYDLQSPLPFSREEYERDFTSPESRGEFENLLKQASAVLELDGVRTLEKEAYEAVGRLVVRQSDVLIAVWNGERPEGSEKKGGTGQIALEAQSLDIPVVRIDSKPPHTISLLSSRSIEESKDLSFLRMQLRGIFLPPSPKGLQAAKHFFQEEQPRWLPGFFFKWFCKAWDWNTKWPKILAKNFLDQAVTDWEETWKILADLDSAADTHVASQVKISYFSTFAWADGLANLYAGKYRSSFTATYLMGAFAIILAYLASLLRPEAPSNHKLPWLLFGELLLIGLIIWITTRGRRRRWHERWMDYRSLAEGLRYMPFLSLLGHVTSSFQVPAHLEAGDPRRSWFHWHFRSMVRRAGLIQARVDGSYISAYRQVLAHAIDSQVKYHADNAAQSHKLQHRLHKTAEFLFILTAVICFLHIVPSFWGGLERALDGIYPGLFHGFEGALSFFAIALPAFGGAIGAISHQAELDRISMRSHALNDHLETLARQLYCLGERPCSRDLGRIALSFTDLALAELVDWRFVFLGKDLTLPA
jgi:Protein of unknown function (DUF4231)